MAFDNRATLRRLSAPATAKEQALRARLGRKVPTEQDAIRELSLRILGLEAAIKTLAGEKSTNDANN